MALINIQMNVFTS